MTTNPVADSLRQVLHRVSSRQDGITSTDSELVDTLVAAVRPVVAKVWAEAYVLGVEDQAISLEYCSDDFGISGGLPVHPARVNPHEEW